MGELLYYLWVLFLEMSLVFIEEVFDLFIVVDKEVFFFLVLLRKRIIFES